MELQKVGVANVVKGEEIKKKKQHSCNQCSYSSKKISHLKTHLLAHSGEKPFKCNQCNYSCTKASHLKTNKKHTREKNLSIVPNAITAALKLVS